MSILFSDGDLKTDLRLNLSYSDKHPIYDLRLDSNPICNLKSENHPKLTQKVMKIRRTSNLHFEFIPICNPIYDLRLDSNPIYDLGLDSNL